MQPITNELADTSKISLEELKGEARQSIPAEQPEYMAQSNDEQPASVQTPHFETTAVAASNDVEE